MTMASLAALQAGLYSKLTGASVVTALVSTRIYDHVPQGATFPYVVIGETAVAPFNDKSDTGLEQAITIHVWSRYEGRKETKEILDAIYQTLERSSLTISGNQHVLTRFVFTDTFLDEDGQTYHGVAIYDVLVTAT